MRQNHAWVSCLTIILNKGIRIAEMEVPDAIPCLFTFQDQDLPNVIGPATLYRDKELRNALYAAGFRRRYMKLQACLTSKNLSPDIASIMNAFQETLSQDVFVDCRSAD